MRPHDSGRRASQTPHIPHTSLTVAANTPINMRKIPVAAADLSGNEETYVVDAIRSSWVSSTGAYINRFESTFAGMCATQTAVGVCNGTVALHLALLALDVRPGDEILVPSLTYIATANACRYVGAEPVFVDVDPCTWCIDPKKIEDAVTPRTRGVIPVHLYGHPADMDAINHLAGVHGLWVVEDAAEAHLARYKGRPTGGLATMATYSFYGNKIFTSGEGGALTLSDPRLELRIRTLRGQGVDPQRRYYFPVTGYNFRMTNVQAAMLCAQLERHTTIMTQRETIFAAYRKRLSSVAGIDMQPRESWADPAPWLFCILIDEQAYGRSRDDLAMLLARDGIETRPFFVPLHTLPPFREQSKARGEFLPETDLLSSRGLNLPTYNTLAIDDIDYIADRILHHRR
jgi:perosamine synthetase